MPHSDTTVGEEPFIMLDIFYPVREDFIQKLKASQDLHEPQPRKSHQ